MDGADRRFEGVMGATRTKMLAALGLALAASPAPAEVAVEARFGFGGRRPIGAPAPLVLRVENGSPDPLRARLVVVDRSALVTAGSTIERRLEVSPGGVRQATLLIPPLFDEPVLRIDSPVKQDWVVTGDGEAGERGVAEGVRAVDLPFTTPPADGAIHLVLGARARQVVSALAAPAAHGLAAEKTLVSPLPLAEEWAPDTWLAYGGVERIVWVEPDPSRLPDPAQLRAIGEFVRFGGELVVLSAGRPERLEDARLAAFLPGPVVDAATREYPSPPGLAEGAFGGAFPVIEIETPEEREDRRPWRRSSARSADWVRSLPSAVRHRVGRGEVSVARFDPLRYDLGDPRVFLAAFEHAAGPGADGRLAFRSIEDVELPSGPVHGALGGAAFARILENENVLTPPLGMFVLFGLVFVLLIGPIDYAVLKRLGRLRWSPWTLLGYTALFSAASIGSTYLIFAPDEQVNRIAIVDLGEAPDGTEEASGWLFHGIYAPYGGTYRTGVPDGQVFGGFVGGLERDMFGNVTATRDVSACTWEWTGPGAQPMVIEMPFNSLRVTAQRFSARPLGTVDGSLARARDGGVEVRVRNGLPTALRNVILVTGDGSMNLEDVPAGEERRARITSLAARSEGPIFPTSRSFDMSAWSLLEGGESLGRREDGDPTPSALRSALFLSSLFRLSPEDRRAGPTRLTAKNSPYALPWFVGQENLRDQVLLLATTDALPFEEQLAAAPAGFTDVLIRRAIERPEEPR